MMSVFVLYDGDDVIDIGTDQELASRRGIKPETVRWYAAKSTRRRKNGRGMVAVKVDVDESEWC